MKKKELIFAVTGISFKGGIASANLNVLRSLDSLSQENKIVLKVLSLLEKTEYDPSPLIRNVSFHGFGGDKFRFSLALLRQLPKNPLFCFDHVSLALPLLPFSMLGLIKIVIFTHGSESWKRIHRMNLLSLRHATLCLTNSHFTLRKMRERIGPFSGAACPLGLSPNFISNGDISPFSGSPLILKSVDGERRVLTRKFLLLVGRMISPQSNSEEGQKGHRVLIRILPELLKEFPDVQLVFPGEGNDVPNLKNMVHAYGMDAFVFFPGQVSLETLKTLYQNCYAFVMPSLQEGFGLVYLEAMNYGKACVGCFDQGAEDIIAHGETGFLVKDPNNFEELLGVLRTLLQDELLVRRLGQNGFQRLHQYFTAEHYQYRIQEQISKILEVA